MRAVGKISYRVCLSTALGDTPIYLRPPKPHDLAAWLALRRENRDFLQPWMPSYKMPQTPVSYRAHIRRMQNAWRRGQIYRFHIFRGDILIGVCSLSHIEYDQRWSARLGYWLGQAYGGRGYGQCALARLCDFGYGDLGLHRLEAWVQPDNNRSVHLLKALGFVLEGCARDYLYIDGSWCDHQLYGRVRK